uniref:Uncharacterized protein n=1 Tax=Rhizophora mucronata TaxID=61149 RepID=A0A2P2QI03_RHIMU
MNIIGQENSKSKRAN